MAFDLPVKGDKVKPQQITALHLFCGLAFIGTGAIIYVYNFEITYWGLALLLAGVLLSLLTIVKNRLITRPPLNIVVRAVELLISVALLTLSLKEQWKFPIGIFGVLSAAILFSLYWERTAGQQLYIRVDEQGIKMPVTSRRRHIPWWDIEEVLLRYSVLSIDCVDNKLYQADLMANANINSVQFEAYCQTQVAANKDKRIKNNW
jgi:hypothetical protein